MITNKFIIALLVIGLLCVSCTMGEFDGDPYYDPFEQNPHDPFDSGYYGETYGFDPYDIPFDPGPYDPQPEFDQYPTPTYDEGDSAFYTTDRPYNAEALQDLGYTSEVPPEPTFLSSSREPNADLLFSTEAQSTAFSFSAQQQSISPNALWIIDAYGNRRYNINLPLYGWAREEIVPAVSGQLVIYEKYPSGHVQRYYPGYVQRGRRYQMWFYADSVGRHDVMYSVQTYSGWYNSNQIWFDVYQRWNPYPWGSGPYWGSSTTIGRTGISISSGGTGMTRITSSDGSISISSSSHFG